MIETLAPTQVYYTIIYNSKSLEATQMLHNLWMD
jgi:hypothetical protein